MSTPLLAASPKRRLSQHPECFSEVLTHLSSGDDRWGELGRTEFLAPVRLLLHGTPRGGFARAVYLEDLTRWAIRSVKSHSTHLELSGDVEDFVSPSCGSLELEGEGDAVPEPQRDREVHLDEGAARNIGQFD